ncbi:MAG TPA: hypothetical protein VG897_15210 [Terriglobales bacterium]|nr:hypothetical protein [Terriglobales bacterium]
MGRSTAAQKAAKVLYVGYRSAALEERVKALREEGFAVDWVEDVGAAILNLWHGGYAALVLGNLVPPADQRLLLREAPRKNPSIRTLTLHSTRYGNEPSAGAWVTIDSGVSGFVAALKSLVEV